MTWSHMLQVGSNRIREAVSEGRVDSSYKIALACIHAFKSI